MGYTHFDKVSGVNGVAKGAPGSEILISGNEGIITTGLWTANETQYFRIPYKATWTGYAAYAVSTGTGRAVTVSLDSAGAEQGTTGDVTPTQTTVIGAAVAITNSANSTLAAGQVIKVALGTCATSQTHVGVTLVLTKA
jgi:hypothetical protein